MVKNDMEDLKKSLEENYLTFVAAAAGAVALIALVVWAIALITRSCSRTS